MVADDDDTPPPTRARSSPDVVGLSDIQLALLQLAEDSGRAAERLDQVPDADRADVLALYARRLRAVTEHLRELLEQLS